MAGDNGVRLKDRRTAKDSAMLTTFQTFQAAFQDGVFVPETRCELPDRTAVELDVRSATLIPPRVTDPEERGRLLKQVIQSMRANPLPADAGRWTREELHERR